MLVPFGIVLKKKMLVTKALVKKPHFSVNMGKICYGINIIGC